jgi:octaprenyl-diphosphate synthase
MRRAGEEEWSMVSSPIDVPAVLAGVCAAERVDGRAALLGELLGCVEADMRAIDDELGGVCKGAHEYPVEKSVAHLLGARGKRLRPMCVALAARLGRGFDARAELVAVSAELIHAATLLHDDVVDLGATRRGAPAARLVYGNAASIFGGDWLLVEALRRIQRAAVPGVLEEVLDVLAEMLAAESVQLACRGRFDPSVSVYMRVALGKTAALFRWALAAGGRCGGLGDDECRALSTYGEKLGVAFQIVDDVLDVAGDEAQLGKALYTDLREGKTTYPLLVALEREPSLLQILRAAWEEAEGGRLAQLGATVAAALVRTGALDEARSLASRQASEAVAALAPLAPTIAKRALELTAVELVGRAR